MVTVSELAFEQVIDFVANGMEVIQAKVHNCVADIRNMVYFLQHLHDQVSYHTGGNLCFAQFLQL